MVGLEAELADLHAKPAALVFTSGWISNLAAISTIAGLLPNALILSDAWNHNSMIEGIRRSGCEKQVFRHNDTAHLEDLLRAAGPERAKIIVFTPSGVRLLGQQRKGIEWAEQRMAAVTGEPFVAELRVQLTAYVTAARTTRSTQVSIPS